MTALSEPNLLIDGEQRGASNGPTLISPLTGGVAGKTADATALGMAITGASPIGGHKRLGVGREWSFEGIEEYTEIKTIAWPVQAEAAE